jgi:hypothetical protein
VNEDDGLAASQVDVVQISGRVGGGLESGHALLYGVGVPDVAGGERSFHTRVITTQIIG